MSVCLMGVGNVKSYAITTYENSLSGTSLCHAIFGNEFNCGGRKIKKVMQRSKKRIGEKDSGLEIAIIEISV